MQDEPDDTPRGIAAETRHVYGPRPVAALLPALTRATFRRRAPAAAQVMADWEAIVGPALARVTVPRRLVGGTLTLACAGPIALELQHMTGELITRINVRLGSGTVRALRFEQALTEAPPASLPGPSPAAVEAAEAAVAGLPDGPLRAALASLGRVVLAGHAARQPLSTTTQRKQ
jgi:hypothetical protein